MSFEFLTRLASLVPWYLHQFLHLVTGTKQFFQQETMSTEAELERSILFYGICIVLSLFLSALVEPLTSDFLVEVALVVTFHVISVVLLAAIAWLIWRLVNAQATAVSVLNALFYVYGVAVLLVAVSGLLASSVIKTSLPQSYPLYQDYIKKLFLWTVEHEKYAALEQSRAFLVSMLVLGFGYIILLLWLVIAWIAYGRSRSVGPIRSTIALILFLIVSYAIVYPLTNIYIASGRDPLL